MDDYEDMHGFPMGALLAVIMLLATMRALWVRRSTWRVPWEMATTVNVVLQTVEIVLISGPVSRRIGPILHTATGLWNMEDLIGHMCYISGMATMTYMILSRLDMSANQFRLYVKKRIELPANLFLPVVVVVFIAAGFGDRDIDLVLTPSTAWTRAYFLLYICADIYLMSMAVPALLVIRRERSQRRIATGYLCAIGISAITCVIMIIGISQTLVWLTIRIETIGYAVAASYGWYARIHGPHDKTPCS
jgi:hypothetical protein